MKNTKRLIVLVGLIFVAGLFFIAADSYADDKLPGYVNGESITMHRLPASVARAAMREKRLEQYKELHNEEGVKLEVDSAATAELQDNESKRTRKYILGSVAKSEDDSGILAGVIDDDDFDFGRIDIDIEHDTDTLGGGAGTPIDELVQDPDPEPEPEPEPEPDDEDDEIIRPTGSGKGGRHYR